MNATFSNLGDAMPYNSSRYTDLSLVRGKLVVKLRLYLPKGVMMNLNDNNIQLRPR